MEDDKYFKLFVKCVEENKVFDLTEILKQEQLQSRRIEQEKRAQEIKTKNNGKDNNRNRSQGEAKSKDKSKDKANSGEGNTVIQEKKGAKGKKEKRGKKGKEKNKVDDKAKEVEMSLTSNETHGTVESLRKKFEALSHTEYTYNQPALGQLSPTKIPEQAQNLLRQETSQPLQLKNENNIDLSRRVIKIPVSRRARLPVAPEMKGHRQMVSEQSNQTQPNSNETVQRSSDEQNLDKLNLDKQEPGNQNLDKQSDKPGKAEKSKSRSRRNRPKGKKDTQSGDAVPKDNDPSNETKGGSSNIPNKGPRRGPRNNSERKSNGSDKKTNGSDKKSNGSNKKSNENDKKTNGGGKKTNSKDTKSDKKSKNEDPVDLKQFLPRPIAKDAT